MFKLSDLYSSLLKKEMATDCGIAIELLNAEVAVLNHRLIDDRVSFFSINLISSGNATVIYGGNRIELSQNDLFISAPGIKIYTETVSDDYSGQCLIVEEEAMYGMPNGINAISASYILANPESDNKLSLTDEDFRKLEARVKDMQNYLYSDSPYKTECLQALYSVFSLDMLYIENRLTGSRRFTTTVSELFISFLKLIKEHFREHHDIEFYSDMLSVTSIYLSRIVKKISGLTVKNHIDRLLMMEAKYLLVRSEIAVTQIGEQLGFETPAGFSKFFLRHQGVSPKDYRATSRKENSASHNS